MAPSKWQAYFRIFVQLFDSTFQQFKAQQFVTQCNQAAIIWGMWRSRACSSPCDYRFFFEHCFALVKFTEHVVYNLAYSPTLEISVKFKSYVEHVKDNFEESKTFIYCTFPNSHINSAFIFFCLADICRRLTQKGKDVAFLPHIVAKRIDLLKQHANYPFQQSQSSLIVKYFELTISFFLDPLHEKEKGLPTCNSLEMDQEVANCLSK